MQRIVFWLVLMSGLTACATKPGSVPYDTAVISEWSLRAIQAGCHHPNGEGQIVHYIPTTGGPLSDVMLRAMRKSGAAGLGGQEKGLIRTLSSPGQEHPVMLLSQVNSHALDVAEAVIKRWDRPPSAAMLCVFADNPRADHLRRLAQEKGFNLHVMPLTGYND